MLISLRKLISVILWGLAMASLVYGLFLLFGGDGAADRKLMGLFFSFMFVALCLLALPFTFIKGQK